MKRHEDDLDPKLDALIDDIRRQELDGPTVGKIADRVWDTVRRDAAEQAAGSENVRPIQHSEDYDALIPGYVAGTLGEAKRLLVEDHMRESVTFRRKVMQARSGGAAPEAVVPRAARRVGWSREWGWALAAALLLTVSLVGLRLDLGILSVKTGGVVTIKQVEGELLRVNQAGAFPIRAGEQVRLDPARDRIRTAKGSRALLTLADGSEVEMNERSQLAVVERHSRLGGERQDSTINLDRGSVIVEAADQGDQRLFVETDECKVEVTGTVFSVNHGTKGSRVSVIEGEVRVHADGTDVLQPGDQVGTNPAVTKVPVSEEIAWSANAERHLALLAELTRLGRELDQVVEGPERRTSTELLDIVPAETVVYIAIPNISGALGQAYEHVQTRVAENPVLNQWWNESVVAHGVDDELDRAMDRIRDYGGQLGEEIVVALEADRNADVQAPLILSRPTGPARLRELLIDDFEEFAASHEDAPGLVVLEGRPAEVTYRSSTEGSPDLWVWFHEGLFAASPEQDALERLIAGAGTRPFTGTAFHGRIADRYRDGVEWLLGVNLERFIADGSQDETLDRMGLLDLRHLIVERVAEPGRSDTRALLSFNQTRRGVASWLAEPAPMGSLDFVSKDASLAGAFVMREPASLLDELFSILSADNENFQAELAEFQRDKGIDVRADFAEPIGGEFAFALDGPVLPKPSWKLVVEVYDPARLQRSIATVLEHVNEWRAEEGKAGFELGTEQAAGGTRHWIRSVETGITVHYVFHDGYLIVAPSQVLIARSLDLRSQRLALAQSHGFAELLPRDGRLNFSAMVYQNLGPLLAPAAGALRKLGEGSPEQNRLIEALTRDTAASLTYAYGGTDQIVVASSSQQGLFGSTLSLFELQSLMELNRSIGAIEPSGP